MIVGAIVAGIAVTLAIIGLRSDSLVERRVRTIWARGRVHHSQLENAALAKIIGSLAGGIVGCLIGWSLGVGALAVPVTAYAGFLCASLMRARSAAASRDHAQRATIVLVEWLHALVSAGRPIESAFVKLAGIGTGSALLDAQLVRVRQDYALGAPLHLSLARVGAESGVRALAELADRVDRARDLGRGMLPMLLDLRDELRAAERARALDVAGHVEGKLTLVLTLCYLPALALLVVIPLFLTLLTGLFA